MLRYFRRVPLEVWICKAGFIAVCAYMVFSGMYPPAHAQSASSADQYGLEIKVAVQGDRIDHIVNDIAEIKASELRITDKINESRSATATENESIGGILAALQVGGIVFGIRKAKVKGIEQ